MPDDQMFNSEAPEAPETPATGEVAPAEPQAPQAGLSAADVQTMIDAGGRQSQEIITQLQSELTALRSQPQQRPVTAEAPVRQSADEFIESFTSDAQGTVEQVAERAAMEKFEQLIPFLEQSNNTANATLLAAEQQAVEAEFGPGSWDTHFAPTINARMADIRQTNASALQDPSVIRNEVLGVKGLKLQQLWDLKQTNATAATEAREAEDTRLMDRFQTAGMSGGVNVTASNPDRPVEDAERDYLASRKLAGLPTNLKSLRASVANTSDSYEGWKAAKTAQGASS